MLASNGEAEAPCIVPCSVSDHFPSSITPGFNHLPIRRKQAGDAQVAVEVERLWQLNADRIGTGNPDLIYPGQELRLT